MLISRPRQFSIAGMCLDGLLFIRKDCVQGSWLIEAADDGRAARHEDAGVGPEYEVTQMEVLSGSLRLHLAVRAKAFVCPNCAVRR